MLRTLLILKTFRSLCLFGRKNFTICGAEDDLRYGYTDNDGQGRAVGDMITFSCGCPEVCRKKQEPRLYFASTVCVLATFKRFYPMWVLVLLLLWLVVLIYLKLPSPLIAICCVAILSALLSQTRLRLKSVSMYWLILRGGNFNAFGHMWIFMTTRKLWSALCRVTKEWDLHLRLRIRILALVLRRLCVYRTPFSGSLRRPFLPELSLWYIDLNVSSLFCFWRRCILFCFKAILILLNYIHSFVSFIFL